MYAYATSVMAESRESFWSSLRALNITRIIIAGVLFAYWGLQRSEATAGIMPLCCVASAAYLGLALLFAAIGFWHRRHFLSQLLTQILVDIVVISVMYIAAGGMKTGLAILFLFPLASTAILMSLVMSLFFASLATFVLLSECAYQLMYQGTDARPMQTGMYGAAFFASVFVVNRLAGRLISQETLAIQRGNDLQVQVAISRLAIDHIDDGVMVINSKGLILACNPAAERMLGLSLPYDKFDYRLADVPFLKPLSDAFAEWKEHPGSGGQKYGKAPIYLMIKRGEDEQLPDMDFPDMDFPGSLQQVLTAHLEVRFATVRAEALQEERSVIFLQDVAKIESQAQQLKLASMGRLTASIAHEVRNPLTAISHATSLLREDITNPAHARLLNIISENVTRMNRMVGDILYLSRKAQSQEVVHLANILAEIRASFREMHGLPEELLWLEVPEGFFVRFDSMHLREVVINLLSNAIRYASGKPGSIRIGVMNPTPGRIELHMQDDGPGMTSETRAHLFEPFFTTSSKGTGLGLYLARELCLNNGARLDYEFHRSGRDGREPPTGRFVITFAAAVAPPVPVTNERISS